LNCSLTCFMIFWAIVLQSPFSQAQKSLGPADNDNKVVEGTLVCLGKDLKEVACGRTNQIYGLKTDGGQLYPLKAHENVEALHVEKRLRTRHFRLTLRQEPDSRFYALVKSQFFRDGQLYDFHYFCEVCNITTHAPGLCLCCREETEYRESPAN
jgi:hypothetical protein